MEIFKELADLEKASVFVQYSMESPNFHEYEYTYTIQYVTKEQQDQKRPKIEYHNSFSGGGATYGGTYSSPKLALEAGIEYAKRVVLSKCIS